MICKLQLNWKKFLWKYKYLLRPENQPKPEKKNRDKEVKAKEKGGEKEVKAKDGKKADEPKGKDEKDKIK